MGAWRTFLLWANREPFGIDRPPVRHGRRLLRLHPALAAVRRQLRDGRARPGVRRRGFTHYVYGGLQRARARTDDPRAYVHLGILGALIALTRAPPLYWLDRYSLSIQKGACSPASRTPTTRPYCPTKAILAVAALSVRRRFFLAAIWSRSWRLPITGVVLLVVTAVVVGGAYPALIQACGSTRRRSRSRRPTSNATSRPRDGLRART